STEDTRHRLRHRRFFEADGIGNGEHIGFNDAAGNADVFRVRAVVEQQVFAEILLVFRTVEAHLEGSGDQRHHAHALLEAAHVGTDFLDDSGEFVTEQRRRHDHAGVISALVDLEVRAAGEGDLNLNKNLTLADTRDGYLFNLYVLFTVEDGCRHMSVHANSLPSGCPAESRPSGSPAEDAQPIQAPRPPAGAGSGE